MAKRTELNPTFIKIGKTLPPKVRNATGRPPADVAAELKSLTLSKNKGKWASLRTLDSKAVGPATINGIKANLYNAGVLGFDFAVREIDGTVHLLGAFQPEAPVAEAGE